MIPLKVLTLIVTHPNRPAALVLQPVEDTPGGKSRIVPIWVGPAEAVQLGVAVEQVKTPRPLTHDLLLDAITNLDARIDHAVINDVKGTTFYSKLFLRQGERVIELDARPSDAVALAVRQDAPLYIEESALERGSFPYIVRENATDIELKEFHNFLQDIAPDDFAE